jgi:hypothetical protein
MTGETGKWMSEDILGPYRLWRAAASEFLQATQMFTQHMEDNDLNAEDLGDWVEMVGTMLSFNPHVPPAEEIEGSDPRTWIPKKDR